MHVRRAEATFVARTLLRAARPVKPDAGLARFLPLPLTLVPLFSGYLRPDFGQPRPPGLALTLRARLFYIS